MGNQGIRRTLFIALTAGLVAAAPAGAVTTVLNFDANANGDPITTVSGVTLSTTSGAPTVFTPSHVATQSPPRALHTPGKCPESACVSGENTIAMTFDTPKSSVSARVGVDSYPAGEFGRCWRLRAYNGDTPVASSGEVCWNGIDYDPITRLVKAQSASTNITRATLSAGQTGIPGQLDLDDLTFTDDAPPPLPAPSIAFTAPVDGAVFDRINDVRFDGRVEAAAGVSRFCLTTSTAATIPADCGAAAQLRSDGTFANMTLAGLHGGANTITAWVEDGRLRTASATITVRVAEPDLRVANMEVLQAVQDQLPLVGPAAFEGGHSATYNGVPLAAGKATAVRVWLGARFDSGRTIPGVFAQLRAFRGPDELPGGPVAQIEPARDITSALSFEPAIPDALRSDPATSLTFRLPPEWTRAGAITLQAVVNPTAGPGQPNECGGCLENNTLRLENVSFTAVRGITVTPGVAFRWRNTADGRVYGVGDDAVTHFLGIRAASPFGIHVEGFRTTSDISSIGNSSRSADDKNSDVLGVLSGFESRNNARGDVVGINSGVARGLMAPVFFCCDPPRIKNLAVMEALRPMTSVAHELYHQEGFAHAGHNCPGDPGGFLGLQATDWPAGDRGLMLAFGYDLRRLGATNPLAIFGMGQTDADGAPIENFDFMSYCVRLFGNGIPNAGSGNADGGNAWISAINWRKAFRDHTGRRARAAGAPTAFTAENPGARRHRGPTLEVHSFLTGSDATTLVEPATGNVSKPAAGSDATIELADAAGRTVASAAAVLTGGHVNGGGIVRVVAATLPAERAAKLRVKVDGKVVDRKARSRHAPRVRLLAPRRGKRIKGTGTTLVRWRARDRDGGRLTASVDFSRNGGRSWRTVALGVRGSSVRLANRLLARSSRARLRVRVSDGWNVGRALSGRLRTAGPPVKARVLEPAAGSRVAAGASLVLRGEATDERGRAVPGSRLRWYDGARLVGRGSAVRFRAVRSGTRALRLVARGADGRVTVARRVLRVRRAAPVLMVQRDGRGRLRVSSTLPGTVRVGARAWRVGVRPRTIRVAAQREVRLRLRAAGVTRTTRLAAWPRP